MFCLVLSPNLCHYLESKCCGFPIHFQLCESSLLQIAQVDLIRSLEHRNQLTNSFQIVDDLQGTGEEFEPFVVEASQVLVQVAVRIRGRVVLKLEGQQFVTLK